MFCLSGFLPFGNGFRFQNMSSRLLIWIQALGFGLRHLSVDPNFVFPRKNFSADRNHSSFFIFGNWLWIHTCFHPTKSFLQLKTFLHLETQLFFGIWMWIQAFGCGSRLFSPTKNFLQPKTFLHLGSQPWLWIQAFDCGSRLR